MNVPVMSLAISFNASCQNETEKWDICLRIMYSGDLMLFFHSLYYSNQSGQNKHTCVNIWSWEHQQLFSIHLEDCKNAKFRSNIWIGCMGEELWCSLCKFLTLYVFICVFMHYSWWNHGTYTHQSIHLAKTNIKWGEWFRSDVRFKS